MSLWTPFFTNPYSAPFAPPPAPTMPAFPILPSRLRVEAKPFEPRGCDPRGCDPRGCDPRGYEPRGCEPHGCDPHSESDTELLSNHP